MKQLNLLKKNLRQKYKKIITKFFNLVYGPIEGSIKKNKYIKIYEIKIKKKNNKIYEINKCRIYTDTIHDTAFIKNNKIIDGPSFQIRNLTNSSVKENKIFQYNTPRSLKKFQGPLLCTLTGGAGNNNYWHWMYDVLPRIGIVENKFKLKNFKSILVPDTIFAYQKETLNLLGVNNRSISSKKFRHIFSEKIVATSHPWQYSTSAHIDIGRVPKWISLWLRLKFLKFKSNKKFFKKIYIDRSDSSSNLYYKRKIINENKIKQLLIKKGFKILKLSDFKFVDQINIFNTAKIIVGNHGAGFANLIFCKKNTKIIEFTNKYTPKTFKKISKDLKLNYVSIKGKTIDSDTKDINNNIIISLNKLKEEVSKS